MGGVVSKILGGGDEGDRGAAAAAQQQIAEQRAENERMRIQTEEQRRDEAERLAARRSARLRGGSRTLLSDTRLTPETGLQTTLGQEQVKM